MKEMTPIEEAVLYLARMMEDPNHTDYNIVEHVGDIIGWKLKN